MLTGTHPCDSWGQMAWQAALQYRTLVTLRSPHWATAQWLGCLSTVVGPRMPVTLHTQPPRLCRSPSGPFFDSFSFSSLTTSAFDPTLLLYNHIDGSRAAVHSTHPRLVAPGKARSLTSRILNSLHPIFIIPIATIHLCPEKTSLIPPLLCVEVPR